MKTTLGGINIIIESTDYHRASKYTWQVRNGVLRAKIFLPVPGNSMSKKPHQITLERFIYKLTPNTNAKILHLPGREHDFRRDQLYPVKKDESKNSIYIGIFQYKGNWWAKVIDGPDTYKFGPYKTELRAAEEHDKQAIKLFGWRAKTNFYYGL